MLVVLEEVLDDVCESLKYLADTYPVVEPSFIFDQPLFVDITSTFVFVLIDFIIE